MRGALLKAAGVLLMLSALALPLSRAPDRPVQTLVGRWAPPPSDFIDIGGQIVHYRDEGPRADALPLVLLHGTASSLHTWEGWVKALKAQRRVVTLDLPGFGLTGPSVSGDYRGDSTARFVLAVLDRLQVRRFVAGGNSMGGEVAWRLATLAPERVAQLVLVDATGLPGEAGDVPLLWRIAQLPALTWLTEEVLPRAFVAQGLAESYGHPERVGSELVERYFELALREGNRRSLGEHLRQASRGADAARLPTLKLPTLILWGGRDTLLPAAAAQRFHAAIAGSQLVVFDDLGHLPQEEDAARSVAPLRAFLGLAP